MAMAWITRVENKTSGTTITLKQNDPTWHPVIGGRQYKPDEAITVAPGAAFDCSFFAIPWQDSGRLQVTGPGGSVTWKVGPKDAGGHDYLKGSSDSGGARQEDIDLGPKGSQFVAPSVEFKLVFQNDGAHWEKTGEGWENEVIHWVEELVHILFEAVAQAVEE